jgi:hypothetical protein
MYQHLSGVLSIATLAWPPFFGKSLFSYIKAVTKAAERPPPRNRNKKEVL